ncbi:MAG: magnesium chelatase subunit H, partial [Chloroflexus aggregans]
VSADLQDFYRWLRPADQERINARWGAFPGDIAPLGRDKVRLAGTQIGNVFIGVQPVIGMPGDPMRLLFDKENTPHHQYALFYRYLSEGFGADAIIHLGMHGTAEWMPGLQLGLTDRCWPDVLLGEVPNFYVYPINNPAEANIAKRRGYSTIIGHAIPPYGRAGLYRELQALQDLLAEYRERPASVADDDQSPEAIAIMQKIALLNLDHDLVRRPDEPFSRFVSRAYAYLRDLAATMITDRLHVLGSAPPPEEQLTLIVETLKVPRGELPGLADLFLTARHATVRYGELLNRARQGDAEALALRDEIEERCADFVRQTVFGHLSPEQAAHRFGLPAGNEVQGLIQHGRALLAALRDNTQELDYLVRGLAGRYIPAAPGGDIIRDGVTGLPTGRNIHSLDPFRIPSDSAYERGVRIAEALIVAHQAETGQYPETIAQVLWGLDAIKTKGESIGIVLGLIGARPIKDGQGKVGRYALIPLAELGRPRVDVLMTASGIFRDIFAGTMDMLDRLVRE